jgi:cytochrome c6
MRKIITIPMIAAAVCFFTTLLPAGEAPKGMSGELLFKKHCAACHLDGGNILNPRKTLHKKDLDENNIKTAEDIVRKMRNPGPFPTHPQDWGGMRMFDEKTITNDEALLIADFILKTFE